MSSRRAFALLLIAPAALAGCFQELNPDAASVGPVNGDSTAGDDAAPIPTLPAPFDVDAAVTQQCSYGSALCYQLCGSPSCANMDNTIPSEVTTIPNVLPDGGTTSDPCDVVRAEALQIRQQSCAMCHGPPPAQGFDNFNFVLDDNALVTKIPQVVMVPLVIPGSPSASVFMQRVAEGIAGSQTGMPPPASVASNLASASVAKSIVYPTASDVSLLYGWILNCVPGTDGGAYSSSYYGGDYGPPSLVVEAGSVHPPPGGDAGGNTVDAGGGG